MDALGFLPNGRNVLCIVPADVYSAGAIYSSFSPTLACVEVLVSGGTLPATRVWDDARPGNYDLLALDSAVSSGSARIAAGDDLGSPIGLRVVVVLSGASRNLPLVAFTLLLIGVWVLVKRLRRASTP